MACHLITLFPLERNLLLFIRELLEIVSNSTVQLNTVNTEMYCFKDFIAVYS